MNGSTTDITAEIDMHARKHLGTSYSSHADLAHLICANAHATLPGTPIGEIWKTHAGPALRAATDAIEHTVARNKQLGTIDTEEDEQTLRTWLHGKAAHHLEHLHIPSAEDLEAHLEAAPLWKDHTRTRQQLDTLHHLDPEQPRNAVDACRRIADTSHDADHTWWRIALKLADTPELLDSIIRHAQTTGEGPPGAEHVRAAYEAATRDDPAAGQHRRQEAEQHASALPRHWRVMLLSGPDTLLWLDLLHSDMTATRPWHGEERTAEEAVELVRTHLAAERLDRTGTARQTPQGWLVELHSEPDDLPGHLPTYIVRHRRDTVHRLTTHPAGGTTERPEKT